MEGHIVDCNGLCFLQPQPKEIASMFISTEVNGYEGSTDRRRLFDENVHHVRSMAFRFHDRYHYLYVPDEDDFTLVGLSALWEQSGHYDKAKNSNFWGYARVHVEGSMLDAVRNIDPISRTEREKLQSIKAERHLLEQTRGEAVTFFEAGKVLGIDPQELQQLNELNGLSFVELDTTIRTSEGSMDSDTELHDVIVDQAASDPSEECDAGHDADLLDQLMDRLDDASRAVVRAHFWNGLREKDIGMAFGLTESRASQILKKAILQMRRGAKSRY